MHSSHWKHGDDLRITEVVTPGSTTLRDHYENKIQMLLYCFGSVVEWNDGILAAVESTSTAFLRGFSLGLNHFPA